jgi:hypothetical protein
MSIKRLTDNEWASYAIGEAIRRHLDEGPRDRATVNTIETVFGWLEHWMTPNDLEAISPITGYLINGPFENGRVPMFTDPVMPCEPKRPPEHPAPPRKPDLQ